MRLQQIVWEIPQIANRELYYRKQDENEKLLHTVEKDGQSILLNKGESVYFNTYFNSFSIGKWRKYTNCNQYHVTVQGDGTLLYQMWGAKVDSEKVNIQLLSEQELILDGKKPVTLVIPENQCDVCYPVLKGISANSTLIGMEYGGESEKEPREISLAIDICTFKREPYLKRNIQMLRDKILENPNSFLYDRTEVFISDNANTLGNMFSEYAHVHVNPNENVGGVGGFTRGMIEAMEYAVNKPFTHILIMDDDAVIEPTAIERTYALLANLKPEYYNATIGGGLLRENTPYVQFESGASWNRGKLLANHHHYDLRDFSVVVLNEEMEHVEYTGWWYTVIPVNRIEESGLPLPLFIHRDDIEYGIRAGRGEFILLNGIAVWHEAFENKMPGATEYYDLRNMAIVNCIHYTDYSKEELKYFLKRWVISNIVRYRYEYVDMNILGIQDFCKGIDWLRQQDGQALHQSIMAMNYKAKPVSEFIGYKGITEESVKWENLEQVEERFVGKLEKVLKQSTFNGAIFPAKGLKVVRPHNNIYDMYGAKEVLYVDSAGNGLLLKRDNKKARECFRKLKKALKELDHNFDEAKKGYAERYSELTTVDYWKQYLKMES